MGGHNNKNPKFHIDDRGKETSATFGLPIQKKQCSKCFITFLVLFFAIVTVYFKELQNYILGSYSVWSIFYPIQVYLCLNFLPILKQK